MVQTPSDRRTDEKPVIAQALNGRLLLVWTIDSILYTSVSDNDGVTWSPEVPLSGDVTGTPAVLFLNTKQAQKFIVVFRSTEYRGTTRLNDFMSRITSLDGLNWDDKQWMDGRTGANPSLVQFNDRAYLFWRGAGADYKLWYTSSQNGSIWDMQKVIDNQDIKPYGDVTAFVNSSLLWVFYPNKENQILCSNTTDFKTFKNIKTSLTSSQAIEIKPALNSPIINFFWIEKKADLMQGECTNLALGNITNKKKIATSAQAPAIQGLAKTKKLLMIYQSKGKKGELCSATSYSQGVWNFLPVFDSRYLQVSLAAVSDFDNLYMLGLDLNHMLALRFKPQTSIGWSETEFVTDGGNLVKAEDMCFTVSSTYLHLFARDSNNKFAYYRRRTNSQAWEKMNMEQETTNSFVTPATVAAASSTVYLAFVPNKESNYISLLLSTNDGEDWINMPTEFPYPQTLYPPALLLTNDGALHLFYLPPSRNGSTPIIQHQIFKANSWTKGGFSDIPVKSMPSFGLYYQKIIMVTQEDNGVVYYRIGGEYGKPLVFEVPKVPIDSLNGDAFKMAALSFWQKTIWMLSLMTDNTVFTLNTSQEKLFSWIEPQKVIDPQNSIATDKFPVINLTPQGQLIIVYPLNSFFNPLIQKIVYDPRLKKWNDSFAGIYSFFQPCLYRYKNTLYTGAFNTNRSSLLYELRIYTWKESDDNFVYLNKSNRWYYPVTYTGIIVYPSKYEEDMVLLLPVMPPNDTYYDAYYLESQKFERLGQKLPRSTPNLHFFFTQDDTIWAIIGPDRSNKLTRALWDSDVQRFTTSYNLDAKTEFLPTFVNYDGWPLLIWKDLDSYHLNYSTTFHATDKISIDARINSVNSPSAFVWDGILHLAYQGLDNDVFYSRASDILPWLSDYPLVTTPMEFWMTRKLNLLAAKKPREILLPGTSNSGCYSFPLNLDLSVVDTICSQNANLLQQLEIGIRYFDLKFLRKDSQNNNMTSYLIHHKGVATDVDLSYCLQTFGYFAATHPRELIILHLSDWKNFSNDSAFLDFLNQVFSELGNYLAPYLPESPLSTFIPLTGSTTPIILSLDFDPKVFYTRIPKQFGTYNLLWAPIFSPFNNDVFQQQKPIEVKKFIQEQAKSEERKDRLWVAPCILIIKPPSKTSLFELADEINPLVPLWAENWAETGRYNIIATNFTTPSFSYTIATLNN